MRVVLNMLRKDNTMRVRGYRGQMDESISDDNPLITKLVVISNKF